MMMPSRFWVAMTYAISGIECIDNISERKFWNSLYFREKPSLQDVREAFPVGSNIQIYEAVS